VSCRRTASSVGENSSEFSVHQQCSLVAVIPLNCTSVYKEKSRRKVLILDGLNCVDNMLDFYPQSWYYLDYRSFVGIHVPFISFGNTSAMIWYNVGSQEPEI